MKRLGCGARVRIAAPPDDTDLRATVGLAGARPAPARPAAPRGPEALVGVPRPPGLVRCCMPSP
ncbi:hypothetical protein GCM10009827_022510 [Dactylosporangium maewongense]|uniref:Uncharacterized protein n=1 Tax=Dactylosporangium maewongense TaxID=634393 RepID=A0ABN1ZYZ6_9ACTN